MEKVIYIKILVLIEKFFNNIIINRFNLYKYLKVIRAKILDWLGCEK